MEQFSRYFSEPDFAGVSGIHFLIQERQAACGRRMVQERQEIEPC
jgi:hypothetical protein